MYVLSRSWLATKTRYVVNLGVPSHRPPPWRRRGRAAAQSLPAPTAPTRPAGHARVPCGSVEAPERLERLGWRLALGARPRLV